MLIVSTRFKNETVLVKLTVCDLTRKSCVWLEFEGSTSFFVAIIRMSHGLMIVGNFKRILEISRKSLNLVLCSRRRKTERSETRGKVKREFICFQKKFVNQCNTIHLQYYCNVVVSLSLFPFIFLIYSIIIIFSIENTQIH